MERIEQQLDAYECELASERELKEKLPEAFSASKESLLLEHINTLSLQRELVGKELSKMYTRPYTDYHALSELQYYASRHNQYGAPLPYAYPAYFSQIPSPHPYAYPQTMNIPEVQVNEYPAEQLQTHDSEPINNPYPYYY
mmetsp:Transcript_16403/g.20282  ORF Transcript_16403/g.20282 Transcript_16403/m.20282 type:complete len:141 (-) Transcript_16403:190-612(-)|eukprot:CAMPEP_0204848052 /NCGR_PEP_ID=MMETSP1347-20130617/3256_1 /ASSEMBLY_ACC=CAM_ASM_000690 /TAXON_ID=215587 /ORGANISM="Aplanochytrium stocchinoi, Strain GSBS06" /LENGTH=140 /DNA_ID=CAMNT_0051989333 /DNA_START=211 /DNA_END=633 /DNA_ORIENTATION=-